MLLTGTVQTKNTHDKKQSTRTKQNKKEIRVGVNEWTKSTNKRNTKMSEDFVNKPEKKRKKKKREHKKKKKHDESQKKKTAREQKKNYNSSAYKVGNKQPMPRFRTKHRRPWARLSRIPPSNREQNNTCGQEGTREASPRTQEQNRRETRREREYLPYNTIYI